MALGQDTPAAEQHGNPFSRSNLRRKIGPSNPLYGLLLDSCIEDIFAPQEFNDHFVVLDTAIWNADADTTAVDFALATDVVSGQLTGQLPNTDNAWIRLNSVARPFDRDHRPVVISAFKCSEFDSDDDLLKVEFGFTANLGTADNTAAGANIGQVLVKATPTNTTNDFSLVTLDTDDNVFWDVIGDVGGTTVTTNVASSSSWNPATGAADLTAGDDAWQVIMVAVNENAEARGWVNGSYIGRVAAAAPAAGTGLGIHLFVQNREAPGGTRDFEIDYIKAWQERAVIA